MDNNGWFVTLCMYIGMLAGALSNMFRRFARRYPLATFVLSVGTCAAPLVYVDFFMHGPGTSGLSLILAFVFIVGGILYASSRSETPCTAPEPTTPNPDHWFDG
jgi:predicted membrane channel-forming protein YqfA (hemolysin III family)